MGKTIALAGKGGTGKTTITGLIIDYLIRNKRGTILAVDADANANLNEVLGIKVETTLGEIKEEVNMRETMRDGFPGGMTKGQYLNYSLNASITEGNGYDLLVMGRSEGKGCYCFVNTILREQLDKVSQDYDYVIMDNEAGMEHLSRGTARSIDILLLVSDCSRRGVQAVGRINKLVKELGLKVGGQYLIINKAPDGQLSEGIMEEISLQDLALLGVITLDPLVYDYDSQGIPSVKLPEDSLSKQAVKNICQKIGL